MGAGLRAMPNGIGEPRDPTACSWQRACGNAGRDRPPIQGQMPRNGSCSRRFFWRLLPASACSWRCRSYRMGVTVR